MFYKYYIFTITKFNLTRHSVESVVN